MGLTSYLDPRLLVIAVRAPFPFSSGGYTWYDVLTVGTPHPEQFKESYERLVQFISDLKTEYPVDDRKIFLLGFSMGTVMSYAYTLTHPEETAGMVGHSGHVPENTRLNFQWERLEGKGFFVAHGTVDPVIGVEFGRRAKELLSKSRADVLYKEYPIAHTMSEESVADFSRWLTKRLTNGS